MVMEIDFYSTVLIKQVQNMSAWEIFHHIKAHDQQEIKGAKAEDRHLAVFRTQRFLFLCDFSFKTHALSPL